MIGSSCMSSQSCSQEKFWIWKILYEIKALCQLDQSRGGDTKTGEGGLIKVKKQVDFNIHFRWFKAFLDHGGFFCFSIKGAGCLGLDP